MRIVFYYINDELPSYSKHFISCIRNHMSASCVVQLTDEHTPAFEGVDSILRSKAKHAYLRSTIGYIGYQYLADMPFDEVIFLDPDMMLNASLEHLLSYDAEVIVASRPDRQHISESYRRMFPYCSMMVVKNRQFWKDCYDRLLRFKKPLWTNNMAAVASVVRSGKYRVTELDGNIYNQMPFRYDKDVKVYHFNVVGKEKII